MHRQQGKQGEEAASILSQPSLAPPASFACHPASPPVYPKFAGIWVSGTSLVSSSAPHPQFPIYGLVYPVALKTRAFLWSISAPKRSSRHVLSPLSPPPPPTWLLAAAPKPGSGFLLWELGFSSTSSALEGFALLRHLCPGPGVWGFSFPSPWALPSRRE